MKCDNCGRMATQTREEYQLCDRCYTKRFSTITIDGKTMNILNGLKLQLEKNGLGREEGESMQDWSDRCRAWTNKTPYGKIIEGAT